MKLSLLSPKQAESQRLKDCAADSVKRSDAAANAGRTEQTQPFATARRRIRYIARAAYYIAVHRSLRHWRWALAAEGTTW